MNDLEHVNLREQVVLAVGQANNALNVAPPNEQGPPNQTKVDKLKALLAEVNQNDLRIRRSSIKFLMKSCRKSPEFGNIYGLF